VDGSTPPKKGIKMELKGQRVEKLKPEQKEKAENTLKKMEETRKLNDQLFRSTVENKLKLVQEEKSKTILSYNQLTEQLKQIQKQVIFLNGAESILKDVLGVKKDA
jgi:uncharacterized protein YaaW (UPF0174 family)